MSMPGANEKFGKTFAPINDVTGRATTVGGRLTTNRYDCDVHTSAKKHSDDRC